MIFIVYIQMFLQMLLLYVKSNYLVNGNFSIHDPIDRTNNSISLIFTVAQHYWVTNQSSPLFDQIYCITDPSYGYIEMLRMRSDIMYTQTINITAGQYNISGKYLLQSSSNCSQLIINLDSYQVINQTFCGSSSTQSFLFPLNITSNYGIFKIMATAQNSSNSSAPLSIADLSVQSTNSPSNCTYCTSCNTDSSGDFCSQCNLGFYLNGRSCYNCSLTFFNCSQCSLSTNCTKCNANFAINFTNQCVMISGNGTNCNNCVQCYYDGVAYTCPNCISGFYSDGTSCFNCSLTYSNCVTCSLASNCTQCQINYALDSNNYCISATNSSNCNNCTACSFNGTIYNCTNCNSGFYLSNSACFDCSTTFSNCLSCDLANNCTNCNLNFYLSNGACSACSTYFSNCISCDQINNCTSCSANYTLNTNGSCIINNPPTNQNTTVPVNNSNFFRTKNIQAIYSLNNDYETINTLKVSFKNILYLTTQQTISDLHGNQFDENQFNKIIQIFIQFQSQNFTIQSDQYGYMEILIKFTRDYTKSTIFQINFQPIFTKDFSALISFYAFSTPMPICKYISPQQAAKWDNILSQTKKGTQVYDNVNKIIQIITFPSFVLNLLAFTSLALLFIFSTIQTPYYTYKILKQLFVQINQSSFLQMIGVPVSYIVEITKQQTPYTQIFQRQGEWLNQSNGLTSNILGMIVDPLFNLLLEVSKILLILLVLKLARKNFFNLSNKISFIISNCLITQAYMVTLSSAMSLFSKPIGAKNFIYSINTIVHIIIFYLITMFSLSMGYFDLKSIQKKQQRIQKILIKNKGFTKSKVFQKAKRQVIIREQIEAQCRKFTYWLFFTIPILITIQQKKTTYFLLLVNLGIAMLQFIQTIRKYKYFSKIELLGNVLRKLFWLGIILNYIIIALFNEGLEINCEVYDTFGVSLTYLIIIGSITQIVFSLIDIIHQIICQYKSIKFASSGELQKLIPWNTYTFFDTNLDQKDKKRVFCSQGKVQAIPLLFSYKTLKIKYQMIWDHEDYFMKKLKQYKSYQKIKNVKQSQIKLAKKTIKNQINLEAAQFLKEKSNVNIFSLDCQNENNSQLKIQFNKKTKINAKNIIKIKDIEIKSTINNEDFKTDSDKMTNLLNNKFDSQHFNQYIPFHYQLRQKKIPKAKNKVKTHFSLQPQTNYCNQNEQIDINDMIPVQVINIQKKTQNKSSKHMKTYINQ